MYYHRMQIHARKLPKTSMATVRTSFDGMLRSLLACCIALCLACLTGCTSSQELPDSGENFLSSKASNSASAAHYDLSNIPEYSGEPYIELNGGTPTFTEDEMNLPFGYEYYSPLDSLGRCGSAIAVAGPETIPEEGSERENISYIHPSGWIQKQYDCVPGKSLYNRSHLIARELTAEEANPENLITGTQYMNQSSMRVFEDGTRAFIDLTGGHVLFRATPIFLGDELLARGVQIEALSLDDGGESVAINVYCYNVQPGITIDYATGASHLATNNDAADTSSTEASVESNTPDGSNTNQNATVAQDYILNTNTHRFHNPDCNSAKQTLDKNKESVHATRQELIDRGYKPCSICNP